MATDIYRSKFDAFIEDRYLPIESKYKLIGLGALVVILALLFYFFLYQTNSEKIAALNKQVATSTMELQKARLFARELPKHEEELKKVKAAFEVTSILLPKEQEIPDLLRNISTLGKTSGLDFLSFVPGREIPRDFYAEIPIDIKIRGPYHSLGQFLDRVSKLERIVTVNNIKTEKVDRDGEDMMLSSFCRLLTYRFTNKKLDNPAPKKR